MMSWILFILFVGKEFLYKHNLISHASIHSGERPYQCSACPKNFRRKDDLQVQYKHNDLNYKGNYNLQ